MAAPLPALLLLAAALAAPALAYPGTPLAQFGSGVPLVEVSCMDGRVLLESPRGTPACVMESSAEKLIGRGFAPVQAAGAGTADGRPEPEDTVRDAASGINGFAADFYRHVAGDGGNVFFSPAGMYMAFSTLYEGARGGTAEEIRGVFGLDPDDAARHGSASGFLSHVNREDPHATLEMANALWISKPIPDPYLGVAREVYGSQVEENGLRTEEDAGAINDWASEKTRGKIPEVVSAKALAGARLAVTNAIYFNGTWLVQFPAEDTHAGKFWKDGTTSVDAEFMSVHGPFGYAWSGGARILQMPYVGDRLSMIAILPHDRDGMGALEESITPELVQSWRLDLRPAEVVVKMPKFTMKTSYDLEEALSDLGMPAAFTGAADFSGISPGLFVGKALHDAFVDVNEEGTEAAAVTTMTMEESMRPAPPSFIADRPFIFVIQDDETGAILFMGRVADPAA